MLVPLLILILATMLAGPIGFVLGAVFLITWALVTGTLHLLIDLILLPFRVIGALAGR